jgi:hypothetical protein
VTCREKLAKEQTGRSIDQVCPSTYGYLPDPHPEWCHRSLCDICWDREIPEGPKEKEKPMSTKKTKAELMEELEAANKAKDDLEKQLAELEKYKTYRTAGDELKAIHTAFMDAGFSNEQAFTLMQTMMMNSMSENLTRDLRKTVRR